MGTYTFKYKKGFFWRSLKNCTSHRYDSNTDKMFITYDNESQSIQIPEWKLCFMKLDMDWMKVRDNYEAHRQEQELADTKEA